MEKCCEGAVNAYECIARTLREMIGCWPVELWWWQGRDVWAGAGAERLGGECLKDDMTLHWFAARMGSVQRCVEGLHTKSNCSY